MKMQKDNILLQARNLTKHFPIHKGLLRRVRGSIRAVDDVTFGIPKGETLALVGESGCGKTTVARLILRAIERTRGEVTFRLPAGDVKIHELQETELRKFRRHMQLIFQDPFSSLNPRMTILETIGEPLVVNGIASGKKLEDRVCELMELVNLNTKYLRRYPHAFSGGQRQRIGIARALALSPDLVVADEPVSALDVSVQAQILNLLKDLQQKLSLTYLFISHDLAVVEFISNRVAVMYVGQIVELADTADILEAPRHPYTEALLAAVPRIGEKRNRKNFYLGGEVADPANPPSGCYFHPRCRYAEDVCRTQLPPLRELTRGHCVRCHLAEQLRLQGV
jgi:peptide/nickel transport system ATP-binding protein